MSDKIKSSHIYKMLGSVLSSETSKQSNSFIECGRILNSHKIQKVLDLGCGEGNSRGYFKSLKPEINWIGLDIESSPEVNARKRIDEDFISYDGIHIPLDNNSVDMIICNQVLEHVREPEELFKDVSRVVKPEGYFIGSVSYMEPFHSYSLRNFTPYGLKVIIENAAMKVVEIKPGVDAFTLIIRRFLGSPKYFDRYWEKESPLNRLISIIGFILKLKHDEINAVKLLFCGQFVFITQKCAG
jgi:ubiquinone/menaquinone biosynthesis C-methylase UbiE